MANVGFIVHAVGQRYQDFAEDLVVSLRMQCSLDCRVYVFSDAPQPYADVNIHADWGQWPLPTLLRYSRIAAAQDTFVEPYLFQLDADMLVVGPLDEAILGPSVATYHPGYLGMTHPLGRAPYFCGAFNGGACDTFLAMASQIADETAAALRSGEIPAWNDETLLNEFYAAHPPDLALSPAYCYPGPGHDMDHYLRIWKHDFDPIILALHKDAHP